MSLVPFVVFEFYFHSIRLYLCVFISLLIYLILLSVSVPFSVV